MFLKCWKDFSLQLAYRTKQLDLSPEIPPDLSKAAESFLLIWERDKPLRPDMYKCKLVLPGGLLSLLWMFFKQLFKQCWSVLWDLSLAKVFDAEFFCHIDDLYVSFPRFHYAALKQNNQNCSAVICFLSLNSFVLSNNGNSVSTRRAGLAMAMSIECASGCRGGRQSWEICWWNE